MIYFRILPDEYLHKINYVGPYVPFHLGSASSEA